MKLEEKTLTMFLFAWPYMITSVVEQLPSSSTYICRQFESRLSSSFFLTNHDCSGQFVFYLKSKNIINKYIYSSLFIMKDSQTERAEKWSQKRITKHTQAK